MAFGSLASLDAIVLDFGGILLEIDFDRMRRALGGLASTAAIARLRSGALLPSSYALESGGVDEAEFRRVLRDELETDVDDGTLDDAWNAILGEPFEGAEPLAASLAAETRLMLLSNTNAIHHARFAPTCAPLFARFHALYFSHEVGMRKPEAAIYARVLGDHGLRASHTVFVDDLEANVDAARALGMRTVLWPTNAGVAGLRDAIMRAAEGAAPAQPIRRSVNT